MIILKTGQEKADNMGSSVEILVDKEIYNELKQKPNT